MKRDTKKRYRSGWLKEKKKKKKKKRRKDWVGSRNKAPPDPNLPRIFRHLHFRSELPTEYLE